MTKMPLLSSKQIYSRSWSWHDAKYSVSVSSLFADTIASTRSASRLSGMELWTPGSERGWRQRTSRHSHHVDKQFHVHQCRWGRQRKICINVSSRQSQDRHGVFTYLKSNKTFASGSSMPLNVKAVVSGMTLSPSALKNEQQCLPLLSWMVKPSSSVSIKAGSQGINEQQYSTLLQLSSRMDVYVVNNWLYTVLESS